MRGAAYGDTKTALHATHNNAERRREISPHKELSCGASGQGVGRGLSRLGRLTAVTMLSYVSLEQVPRSSCSLILKFKIIFALRSSSW